jgi:tellurite methyltransferase
MSLRASGFHGINFLDKLVVEWTEDRGSGKVKQDQKKWDARYREKEFIDKRDPDPFLKKHVRSLPRGKALDLAAGEGRNAVFLAQHGFEVEAIDISRVALNRARKLAQARGVKIRTIAADLDNYPIPNEVFDLIIDFYFLDRRLFPKIKKGLKKGGMVVMETYLVEQKASGLRDPVNPEYLLKPNELLRLFQDFRILFYREGVFKEGGSRKAIASLIAEKT